MALTEKELKRIADIQDRINRGVKIQTKTQDELNKLLEKQVKEQQKLNKEFDLGAKAQRLQSSFAKQQKKLEDDYDKIEFAASLKYDNHFHFFSLFQYVRIVTEYFHS